MECLEEHSLLLILGLYFGLKRNKILLLCSYLLCVKCCLFLSDENENSSHLIVESNWEKKIVYDTEF